MTGNEASTFWMKRSWTGSLSQPKTIIIHSSILVIRLAMASSYSVYNCLATSRFMHALSTEN